MPRTSNHFKSALKQARGQLAVMLKEQTAASKALAKLALTIPKTQATIRALEQQLNPSALTLPGAGGPIAVTFNAEHPALASFDPHEVPDDAGSIPAPVAVAELEDDKGWQ